MKKNHNITTKRSALVTCPSNAHQVYIWGCDFGDLEFVMGANLSLDNM